MIMLRNCPVTRKADRALSQSSYEGVTYPISDRGLCSGTRQYPVSDRGGSLVDPSGPPGGALLKAMKIQEAPGLFLQ